MNSRTVKIVREPSSRCVQRNQGKVLVDALNDPELCCRLESESIGAPGNCVADTASHHDCFCVRSESSYHADLSLTLAPASVIHSQRRILRIGVWNIGWLEQKCIMQPYEVVLITGHLEERQLAPSYWGLTYVSPAEEPGRILLRDVCRLAARTLYFKDCCGYRGENLDSLIAVDIQ